MEKKRQVAIVHYNTPELTEAAILSLRLHGGEDYHITVMDNSDERPFTVQMPGVTVLDNTKGKLVNFEKELAKHPDRCEELGNIFGSAKHMMSVQYLMDKVLKQGFVLMDSDVLIKAPIDMMFMPDRAVCGYIQTWQTANNPGKHDRLVPMLLWLNVPMLKKGKGRMYDPKRCFALQAGGRDNPANWYDTGAALLEDVRTHRNGLNGTCLSRDVYTKIFIHYQQGSWRRTDQKEHMAWLQRNAKLWAPATDYPLGPVEGTSKQLKIYICTHKDFVPRVKHPAYEVMDARDFDNDVAPNGLGGLFYSEVLSYWRLTQQKQLPKWIGFCGWRKYWEWMSRVPEINEPIVCRRHDVGTTIREHYAKFANPKDLELATAIIDEKHKDFSPAWHQALDSNSLHPFNMFVIQSKDFRRMMKLVWAVLDEFVKRAGDIDKRIDDDPEGYHVPRLGRKYAYRIGGQIAERIISAWMDWQLSQARQVGVKVTDLAIW